MVAIKKNTAKYDQRVKEKEKEKINKAKEAAKTEKAKGADGDKAKVQKAEAAADGNFTKDQTKQIIKEVSDEFGIDSTARGTKAIWKERAKTDPNITVEGDVLTINSKQHGVVKIQMGGDGEINGGDDKLLSVGGQAAGNAVNNGLNQINNPNAPTAAPTAATNAAPTAAAGQQAQRVQCPVCGGKGCPTCGGTGYVTQQAKAKDPVQAALAAGTQGANVNPFQPFGRGGNLAANQLNEAKAVEPTAAAQQAAPTGLNFNQTELQNLLAAIMHNGVFFMDQFQQNNHLKAIDPMDSYRII